ncbi:MAG: GNAT family N-acetyltransferase [Hungatella sp.]
MKIEKTLHNLDEVYEIYLESFPEMERRTREGQYRVFEHAHYHIYGKVEDGMIVAFLGYWELPSCLFVEHLASRPECRGRKFGEMLVQECLAGTDKPVFLEIEPITEADPFTGRRAGFYERQGFVVNRFPYEQMPLKEGDEPMPLWIMSRGKPFSQVEFFPFKKEIYEIVYQVEHTPL